MHGVRRRQKKEKVSVNNGQLCLQLQHGWRIQAAWSKKNWSAGIQARGLYRSFNSRHILIVPKNQKSPPILNIKWRFMYTCHMCKINPSSSLMVGATRFHFIKEIPKIYKRKYATYFWFYLLWSSCSRSTWFCHRNPSFQPRRSIIIIPICSKY